jgi:ankyrin repeat protein
MFAAAAGRTEVVEVLLEGEADPSIAAKVVDLVERNEYDQSERRERNKHIAKLRAAAMKDAPIESSAPRETETEPEDRDEALRRGGEPVPLDYAALVSTHGGLTPLLLAAREGHVDTTLALIQGTADINQVSAADNTSPILIAMFNGHFDLAMQLFELGADPSVASDAGATPLYAALNMHWAPKARHPQPVAYMQQELTYLEVMETLLKAGVDPNVRLNKTLWYTTYNRDLLGVNRAGATPFWRAAHALDIDAMRLLLAHGADPNMPTLKIPERKRRGGDQDNTDHSGLPPVPLGGPAVYPIHAASGVGHGQGFAGNSHRHVPDGWLPAVKFLVEELGADANARDYKGYNTVHHAAARGDNELIRYLVSKGAEVTFVSRKGQTTADMANGPVQRVQPYPETVALLVSLGATNNHKCVSC